MLFRICAVLCNFYPRPPRGGRPVCFAAGRVSVSISIHALREEGDSSPIFKKVAILNFYPRPPRGGRRGVCAGIVAPELISIHALREEGDQVFDPLFLLFGISIHALREEGDRFTVRPVKVSGVFLSTPSARRATRAAGGLTDGLHNFYPRPPRGGRPFTAAGQSTGKRFLSTPSARRATNYESCGTPNCRFLSTPSARRATPASVPLERCRTNFYPRPPRGGRQAALVDAFYMALFLSTPSARRATPGKSTKSHTTKHFYPRPPRGGRQQKQRQNLYFQTNYTTFCTNLEEP